MKIKDKYTNLTEDNNIKLVLWAFGYEDENGNIRCGFLEEFDKAMKAEFEKYGKDQKEEE